MRRISLCVFAPTQTSTSPWTAPRYHDFCCLQRPSTHGRRYDLQVPSHSTHALALLSSMRADGRPLRHSLVAASASILLVERYRPLEFRSYSLDGGPPRTWSCLSE